MNARAQVTPEAKTAPAQLAGGAGPPPNRRPSRVWLRRAVIMAAAAIALSAAALVVMRGRTRTSASQAQILSFSAPRTLRLKGTTEAVESRAILAPVLEGQQVPTLTIIQLAGAGTRVKQGDLLVEFDRQAQMRDFIDKQAEYRKLLDQVAEEQAKENATRAKDETELKQAEDDLRKAQLEVQKAELVSKIDAEKIRRAWKRRRPLFSS